jgi:anti-sigma factor RsiW
MNKNPCDNEALLSALLDGELPAATEADVRRHLEICPRCRQRLEILRQADTAVQGIPPIEPSEDFERSFWGRIDELEGQGRRSERLFSRIFGRWPAMAAGLTAAGLLFLLIYTGREADLTPEEVFIAQNMELLQEYDMIEYLDILEQWDVFESMEEST